VTASNGWVAGRTEACRLASTLIGMGVSERRIPELPERFPTLREACDAAAEDVVSMPYDEFLVLLSGGADSTLAAAAISRPAAKSGKRVVYAVTASGLADLDPRTLRWLLDAEGAEVRHFCGESLDAYSGGLVITGVLGDELYCGWLGSIESHHPTLGDDVWRMTPGQLISLLTGLNDSPALCEKYMPVFAGMPYSFTAPNMLHWLAFKYLWDRERHTFTAGTALGLPGDRHIHFFEHLAIQHWMMQEMEVRCGKLFSNRKNAGIELIREYVGCEVAVPQKNLLISEIASHPPTLYGVYRIDPDGTVHRR